MMLCIAACTTTPTRFYTLVPDSSSPSASASRFAIELLPVHLPAQADQPQFVIRQGQGEVALAEQHQWVAPLPEEYRAGLSAQLSRRLGAADVYRVPKPEGTDIYSIRVRVQRFDSMLSSAIHQDVLWSLSDPKGEPFLTCSSTLQEAAEGGYLALAEAHQQAIGKLAETIAATLEVAVAGAPAKCP